MFDDGEYSIVIADIPGLIEGASAGRGLGHQFLRHIERTRVLVYVLDVTHPCEENVLEDFLALRNELMGYKPLLIEKPCIVVMNKMDLYDERRRNVENVGRALENEGIPFYTLSALTGQGVDSLQKALSVRTAPRAAPPDDREPGSMLTNRDEEGANVPIWKKR
jgi:GTP-binding protein